MSRWRSLLNSDHNDVEAVSKVNFIKSAPNNTCLCALCVPISVTSVVKLYHRGHKEGIEIHRAFMAQNIILYHPFYFTFDIASNSNYFNKNHLLILRAFNYRI